MSYLWHDPEGPTGKQAVTRFLGFLVFVGVLVVVGRWLT